MHRKKIHCEFTEDQIKTNSARLRGKCRIQARRSVLNHVGRRLIGSPGRLTPYIEPRGLSLRPPRLHPYKSKSSDALPEQIPGEILPGFNSVVSSD